MAAKNQPKRGRLCLKCFRPKWTDDDLARWQKEFGAGDNAVMPKTEPVWSRAICWSNEIVCPNDPLPAHAS